MSEGSLSIEPAEGAGGPAATAPDEAAADQAPTAPPAVTSVSAAQAEQAVTVEPAQAAKLDAMVEKYVRDVTNLDVHVPAFAGRVRDIQTLGNDDIRAAADVSNRLLQKPLAAVAKSSVSDSSDVSRALFQLRRTVEDLDPQGRGNLKSPKRLLGVLPLGNRVRSYFLKYQSSQGHINAILQSLQHGQEELQKDNADIEQEKANLWAVMARLRQYIYLAQHLDSALAARISEIQANDADRATTLREDLLFPARQKVQDLLTQLAVSVQGYLALDLVRRNNVELSKGVDRASTTTVSALRTAIIVAQALSDQRLVLDQIMALNTTTSNLIASTAEMLRQQSGQISEQAASSTVDLARLQAAFNDIYATMDEVDGFKVRALESMSKTIDALSTEIARSRTYLDRGGTPDSAAAGTETR